jgi:peptidoglycan-associated lipoprotein
MTRGLLSSPSLALVAVLTVALSGAACKTVQPPQDASASSAPDFNNSAKPAEKVDESSGFKEATPSEGSFGETSSNAADKLNAQGVLKPIYFDFDRAELRADAAQTLTANAARIREIGSLMVRVEGHCDERGTVEYNLALGDRRARAAKDQLMSLGVPAGRLRTISYGKERPADPGHDEASWAKNRRAEFVFIAE